MIDAAMYLREMTTSRTKLTLTPLDAELNMPEITVADDIHGAKTANGSGNTQDDQKTYEAVGLESDTEQGKNQCRPAKIISNCSN